MKSNKRMIPHVCGKCKDLILPPFDYYAEFMDVQCTDIKYICNKCREVIK